MFNFDLRFDLLFFCTQPFKIIRICNLISIYFQNQLINKIFVYVPVTAVKVLFLVSLNLPFKLSWNFTEKKRFLIKANCNPTGVIFYTTQLTDETTNNERNIAQCFQKKDSYSETEVRTTMRGSKLSSPVLIPWGYPSPRNLVFPTCYRD